MTATTYELWHAASGNFLEDFESEAEALAAVREYLDANGPDMVHDLALGAVPSTGLTTGTETPPFLRGAELLARIEAVAQPTTVSSPGAATLIEPARQPVIRREPTAQMERSARDAEDRGAAASGPNGATTADGRPVGSGVQGPEAAG